MNTLNNEGQLNEKTGKGLFWVIFACLVLSLAGIEVSRSLKK